MTEPLQGMRKSQENAVAVEPRKTFPEGTVVPGPSAARDG